MSCRVNEMARKFCINMITGKHPPPCAARCKIKVASLPTSWKNMSPHHLILPPSPLQPLPCTINKWWPTSCIICKIADSLVGKYTHTSVSDNLYAMVHIALSSFISVILWKCNYSFLHKQMCTQRKRCILPCKTTFPNCQVKLFTWKLDVVAYLTRWSMETFYFCKNTIEDM